MGLDIGTKRIGVALSDELGITAQGICAIERTTEESAIAAIKDIIKEKGVGEIVVGLPLNMDGSEGKSVKEVLLFLENFKKSVETPVKLWDERMSTVEVERLLVKADVSRKKRKKKIDKMAAQIILQGYLNAK